MIGTETTAWDIAAAVGTLIAAAAAAAAAVASAISARHAREVAERDSQRYADAVRARKRAQVVGRYVAGEKSGNWLQIDNYGPAVADRVSVTVEPPQRHLDLDKVPGQLHPGVPIHVNYTRMPGTVGPVTTIRWTDIEGEHDFAVHPTPVILGGVGRSSREITNDMKRLQLDLEG